MKIYFNRLIFVLISFICLTYISCQKEDPNTSPIAKFTVDPIYGDTETIFTFDASNCSDLEDDESVLMVRWDWNNDSIWDTDYLESKTTSHQFDKAYTHTVLLEVKDSKGLCDTVSLDIIVMDAEFDFFVDIRDDQTYKFVKIGTQLWMRDNMNYYTPSGSWCYEEISSQCESYGRLYDYISAINICPSGWHLPSDGEWKQLERYLGMSLSETHDVGWRYTGDVGDKLKDGTQEWYQYNSTGNNESGFTARPSGHRLSDGTFTDRLYGAAFWTSNSYPGDLAWARYLSGIESGVHRVTVPKNSGRSVRCIKN